MKSLMNQWAGRLFLGASASFLVFAGFQNCSGEFQTNGNNSSNSVDSLSTSPPQAPSSPSVGVPVTAPAMPALRYVGRWDFSDPAGARSTWSGSAVQAQFSGSSVSATINTPNIDKAPYYVAIVDGAGPQRLQGAVGTFTYQIATGLASGPHTVQISREFEGFYGVTQFIGFDFGGGRLLSPPNPAKLKMEIIGDSISAGYGNVGLIGYPAKCTGVNTNNESNYMAYGSVLGRMLGAEVSTVAYSGFGIYRNYAGQVDSLTAPTMDELYQDVLTFGLGINLHQYLYTAPANPMDIVVINLGTNDLSSGVPTAEQFESSYKKLINEVRKNNPQAQIFLTIGPMIYEPKLSTVRGYFSDLVNYYAGLGETKIHQVSIDPQDPNLGVGCDYHPSAAEDLLIAKQLATQIQPIMGTAVSSTDPNPLLSW